MTDQASSAEESEQPAGDPAKKDSRAGRNLPAAIGVAAVLIATLVGSLFLYKPAFVAFVLLIAGVGVFELSRAFGQAGIRVPVPPVLVGALAVLAGAYQGGPDTVAVGIALSVLAVFIWRFTEGADGFVRDASAGILVLVYLPLLGSFAILMVAESDGPWRILTFVLATIASDTGGYAAGVLFGKHPMAPSISPKKSWEGFCGSLVLGIAGATLGVVFMLDGDWWVGVVLGIAAVVAATLGDLTESLIKRDLGVKDMGTLLPGHGGAMDRLDSLLAVAPVAWLVLYMFVPAA